MFCMALLLTFASLHGMSAPRRPHLRSGMAAAGPAMRAKGKRKPADFSAPDFELEMDLGVDGRVVLELAPFFTSSQLITFRFPLPFALEAEQHSGVIEVDKAGQGLLVGDVLRAFSTFEYRLDTEQGGLRYAEGVRGARPQQPAAPPALGFNLISAELGGFREKRPTKVIFLADGQTLQAVTDALLANTADKTSDLVMVFERPL